MKVLQHEHQGSIAVFDDKTSIKYITEHAHTYLKAIHKLTDDQWTQDMIDRLDNEWWIDYDVEFIKGDRT